MNTETIARRIKEQILSFDERLDVREQGRVMSCADGIARVSGLQDVMAGELLYFPHAVRGIAMNLEEDAVGAALLGEADLLFQLRGRMMRGVKNGTSGKL